MNAYRFDFDADILAVRFADGAMAAWDAHSQGVAAYRWPGAQELLADATELTPAYLRVSTDIKFFELHRDVDASGVSGEGVVAAGVRFPDGQCAMRWNTGTASTAIYASSDELIAIHGHGGATRLVWL